MRFCNPVGINFDVKFSVELRNIAKKPYKKFLFLSSKTWNKNGVSELAREIFKDKIIIIDDICANPELSELIYKKSHLNIESCAIIAFGGGSVIDSAKFLALDSKISAKNGNLEIENINNVLDIFAFPTISGSSAELTKWATIWDKRENIKYSLSYDFLYAKEAFYDCLLFLSAPKDLTINTALDSLSHALESIWNKNANEITIFHATRAIELILKNLSSLELNNLAFRKNLALASLHSGLAFSNTQTALAHAISYPLTMKNGIPHGLACSFSLPLFLKYVDENRAEFGDIYRILKPFMNPINALFSELGVSTRLKDYKIDSKFLDEIFASLNSRAQNSVFDTDKIKRFFHTFL